MKVGIYYGTTTGTTEDIANRISTYFEDVDVIEVSQGIDNFLDYDLLILGSPTWGLGDLQDEWMIYIDEIEDMDLSNKYVALFGTGDQASFSDSFIDAIEILYNKVKKANAKLIGFTSTEGYNFDRSTAVKDGKFICLAIDELNQPELSDERVENWCEQLKKEMGI